MKRIYLFTLLVLTFLSLSVTAGYTQQLDPGCSPTMWSYMEDQADAMRARNKAYEREILNRQPSTLYLTCFDQAMALSARLGFIFSDNVMPNPPPANTVVFDDGSDGIKPPGADAASGTVAFPGWGAQQSLAIDLYNVVNPEFDNWLDATAPSPAGLFNFLPQWVPGPANNQANNQLTKMVMTPSTGLAAIITQIQNFQNGPDADNGPVTSCTNPPPPPPHADEKDYIALVMDINDLIKSFPTITLTDLPTALDKYTTLTGWLDCLVKAIETNRDKVMAPLLAQLKTDVMNVTMGCTRMDDMWNTLDSAFDQNPPPGTLGAFYPPEGKYYLFSPFYTLGDLLNYGAPPPPPGQPPTLTKPLVTPPKSSAMADFVQELNNTTDNDALQHALDDLAGPLAQAGNDPLWPAPPVFKQNATMQDIINAM